MKFCRVAALFVFAAACARAAEPRLSSLYPLTIERARPTHAIVRGVALAGAHTVVFRHPGVTARLLRVDTEDRSTDVVHLELTALPEARPEEPFRLLTPNGVSNELTLHTTATPVAREEDSPALDRLPLVLNGRLAQRGEVDRYWLEVARGQTLTVEARSGFAPFDTALVLLEPSGSWFDGQRLNPVAFNDEPLHFPGLDNSARLVHRFARPGRYVLEVRAFAGQGGADYTYSLLVRAGEFPPPPLHPPPTPLWEERRFTRSIAGDWLVQLHRRGLASPPAATPETFSVADAGRALPLPVFLTGRIAQPAEVHSYLLAIDKPQDIAIEVETPLATLPRFNPVVRLLDERGNEIVTNVYTKLNNNGLYMMKMIQAKSTVTLRSAGNYRLEVRDITTDCAAADFAYRILIRPQVPHIGKVVIASSPLNLARGQAKPVTVQIEREEDFKGFASIAVEGLPPGVTAHAALANPVEKPPLPNGGRLERYTPREQSTTILFTAAPDAPLSQNLETVRVIVRPVVDSVIGPVVAQQEIPLMVIPNKPS
jgi:hypothetical protein